MSQPDDIQRVTASIQAEHPRLDVIISSAGNSIRRPVLQDVETRDLIPLAVEWLKP